MRLESSIVGNIARLLLGTCYWSCETRDPFLQGSSNQIPEYLTLPGRTEPVHQNAGNKLVTRATHILITNLMHWLLFIHKILFSSTFFDSQVLFKRILLYTCSIWQCHSLREFVVACRCTAWVRNQTVRFAGCCSILQTGHITLSSTPDQLLENHSTKIPQAATTV